MTPDHPGFAAAVCAARRDLAERIAARGSHGRTSIGTSAAAATAATPIVTVQPAGLPPAVCTKRLPLEAGASFAALTALTLVAVLLVAIVRRWSPIRRRRLDLV